MLNIRTGIGAYLLATVALVIYALVSSSLVIATMVFVAAVALLTVILVMWLGSKEDLGGHLEHSKATTAWQEREARVNAARQALVAVADGGEITTSAGATASGDDEAEARRQAALARKAARASKSPAGE